MAKKKKNKEEKRRKALEFAQRVELEKNTKRDQSIRSKYRIPGSVALPKIEEEKLREIAVNCYVLVFANYNYSACGLLDFTLRNQSEGLIRLLDRMSKTTPSSKSQIVRDTIKRNQAEGEYLKLFSSLSADIEYLHESQFSGDGRVFFFTLESPDKNYLNVVSIRPNHLKK